MLLCDEDILSVKGGRQVSDAEPSMDDESKRERVRQICALKYLHGYPDTKVIDPIKENYPACTMPLSATAPTFVTPEILCNTQYAQDHVAHTALIREMLDQASLSTNPALLERSSNKLFQSLGGLLRGASRCQLTREPTPVWKIAKVVRTNPTAELVRKTISLMRHDEDTQISMPCAPMPIPDVDDASLMHPALVTDLTGSKPYYREGGLIPHLSKKGFFWKSTRPAIHETVLRYRFHIDPINSDYLKKVDKVACGWMALLPKISDYNASTGLHKTLGPECAQSVAQYWPKSDGTTAKAASLVVPPSWSGSVHGLTQHFEQLSMTGGVHTPS